jgi:Mce-associated membrane protein
MSRLRSGLVIAATVALVSVGAVGWLRAVDLHRDSPARNAAVVDVDRNAQLVSAVSKGLTEVLSYDYRNPEPTAAAAQRLLSGAARDEHATLFAELRKKAPGQNLVLTAQVQATGVTQLSGDSATLLVFLDQSSQRAGDKEATVSAAQLVVSAALVSGEWKISGIRPL